MPYRVSVADAQALYPEYNFVRALTPSEQKAAFHVRNPQGDDLCLKLIAPSHDIDRVNREIQSLQEISHPNVVRILEYTNSIRPGGTRHHILEEYVDGRDLTDLLATGPVSLAVAKELFSGILSGLEALGAKSIVHRDLKPANIRVRPNGQAVIIDFGLARLLTAPDLTDTTAGAAIGTPIYFAPEQFRNTKREIDPRTDLFAAGVLIYEAVVGAHPFYKRGMTRAEFEKQVCESTDAWEAEEFEELPTTWRLLLKKLMAKDRVGRPGSAGIAAAILSKAEVH